MIIVEITVPSLDEKYDFQLDENVQLLQLRAEICEVFCKRTGTVMLNETMVNNFLIASIEQRRILDLESSLSGNGITNGHHLILL